MESQKELILQEMLSIASNKNETSDKLREIYKVPSYRIKEKLAKNPNTPQDILLELSLDENIEILYGLCDNENASSEMLDNLSKSRYKFLKVYIAKHSNALPKTLIYIYENMDEENEKYIKKALAQNPNTPQYILIELSNSKKINESLALNSNTPIDILRDLSKFDDEKIILNLLYNKSTTSDILEYIANCEKYKEFIGLILAHPNISTQLVEKLILDKSLRSIIAINKNTSQDILVKLSKDEDVYVRSCVAVNRNTPLEAFEELIKSTNKEIEKYNIDEIRSKDAVYNALHQLKIDGIFKIRASMARNPNTPDSIFEKLIEFKYDVVTITEVARNQSAPIYILKKIEKDKINITAAQFARENLNNKLNNSN